ncbi:hypothetical protein DUNSADRAFT_2271 [Dunaliella salina]|uniref:Encoded protein n=1 Tax=Dunaliella salina TaxID=3046 RepID=A0ABQ7FWH1_DUNSA|nr:hypothetical protein DUNSADRAFT_2271 [Dunaliella salina]|eukprot:KAF5826713.1 hypothetical protein DUNSADRAFT_2271 [Dunaliella salina]
MQKTPDLGPQLFPSGIIDTCALLKHEHTKKHSYRRSKVCGLGTCPSSRVTRFIRPVTPSRDSKYMRIHTQLPPKNILGSCTSLTSSNMYVLP